MSLRITACLPLILALLSIYRRLGLLDHIAVRFALMGSPKTAAPVCVLTRRAWTRSIALVKSSQNLIRVTWMLILKIMLDQLSETCDTLLAPMRLLVNAFDFRIAAPLAAKNVDGESRYSMGGGDIAAQ